MVQADVGIRLLREALREDDLVEIEERIREGDLPREPPRRPVEGQAGLGIRTERELAGRERPRLAFEPREALEGLGVRTSDLSRERPRAPESLRDGVGVDGLGFRYLCGCLAGR
ncbi:MAG: hypothetical protein ACUVYA_17275, partial [Planctomycetota bacterium]